MTRRTLSRRHFGALLGGTALGATLLPRWLPHARAQATGAPMRFLSVRTPHGVDRDIWIPRPAGGGEPASADMALADLTFEYTDSVLGPMMPWRDKITVLDGLDTQVCKEATRAGRHAFHGHNEQGAVLTGAQPPSDREGNYDNHPSLDFYLHSRLPSPALLTASVEGTGTWKCMSYDDGGRPREPTSDPREVFSQAFPDDFVPPTAGEPTVDFSDGEARIALYGEGALMRLRERLVGTERDKLDSHLEAMASLQGPGGGPVLPTGMCLTSGMDGPTRDGNVGGTSGVEEITRAHSQVIGQAFACGRSRIATLQILNDYPNYYTDLPEVRTPTIIGRYGDTAFRFHESLVHDYWTVDAGTRMNMRPAYSAGLRWNAGHFAAVLEELDGIVDPLDPAGGSILDNTIVFWHNEFGHDGHDNQHTRHPSVIAGGGGRVLKIGRYLRLRNIQSDERVPHNKLLTSICLAMGLDDIDYFGDRDLTGRAEYQGPLLPLMV